MGVYQHSAASSTHIHLPQPLGHWLRGRKVIDGPPAVVSGQLRVMARLAVSLLVCCALLEVAWAAPAGAVQLPPVGHVWVIVLENENYASTFGAANSTYFAKQLPAQGALLEDYWATAHDSNADDIALISGQPPNVFNQADCPVYGNMLFPSISPGGIENGLGCVFPASVPTLGAQLTSAGLSWKAYEEDMGNVAGREPAACAHPQLGAFDSTQFAVTGDGYVPRHDPFVYFHSVIDDQTSCNAHVVALGSPTGVLPPSAAPGETGLVTDLQAVATTPNFSYITPDLCDGGHDFPCVNEPNGPFRLADINAFLQTWVAIITGSPAFRQDGLLEIVFDEARSDATACCGETGRPGSLTPGLVGPGGGRVGAVLISPFIKPGTVSATPYNHYSSLASWEAIFGLPPLADAATVPAIFGADVFTNAGG